jgi:polyhydroxyalkanoate synthesis regulator phasin
MVLEGLRGYIQLANGLTDVTRERALAAARSLVAQGEAGVDAVVPASVKSQVGSLTDDLIATSKANRALLVHLVRAEVERAVARAGLAPAKEVTAATRRAERLEHRVADLERELTHARSSRSTKKATTKKTTKKSAAKKTTKKTAAKKTAKKTAAKKTAKKSP